MADFPMEIQLLMAEMEAAQRERMVEAARADPVKHKLTTVFPTGSSLNYRYWRVKGKRGPTVDYCYSTERNAAGYFLGWREVWDGRREIGRRDQWMASKRRKTVADAAKRRRDAHQARLKGAVDADA